MKVKSENESEVVSDSWRPHGLQPTRLLHPWDFPDKSTGVGCHFPLPTIKKNEFLLFAATWMGFKSTMLNEMSKKNKYYMMSLMCEI